MTDIPRATDTLLSLLRLGEQLAEGAFDRISRAFAGTPLDRYQAVLLRVSDDERRHDRLLSTFARPDMPPRVDRKARRFYLNLRDPEPGIHLARIAALDGCVCQIISHVLAVRTPVLALPLRDVLAHIRRDEGHHVRIARRLTLERGTPAQLLDVIDDETRAAFSSVLARYTDEFTALGVDADNLLRCIHRVDR